jgi:predicted metalloprotease with PDZ domain
MRSLHQANLPPCAESGETISFVGPGGTETLPRLGLPERLVLSLLITLLSYFAGTASTGAEQLMRLEVDAREISRQLLHASLELPARSGPIALWYPKWIPGTHAPGGPVQNIGGLRFETPDGQNIPWQRDDDEPYRLQVEVPAGVDRLIVRLEYICNQPTVNSDGVDSIGNTHLGVINWNTCLLYPEGISIDDLKVSLRLRLPARWKFGTALKLIAEQKGETAAKATPHGGTSPAAPGAFVEFKPETLRDLIDCPLITGEFFRTIAVNAEGCPPSFLHLTSESPSALQIDEKLIGQYRNLVSEAMALFGRAPFFEYHFLVVCSDQLEHSGLEHLTSSFNAVTERELIDEKKRKSWPAYLLPHEFVHAWCGKYRRPAEMVTTNFHTPERTRLLWVYEGLTEYLGEVLTVRSGLASTNEYLPWLGQKIDLLLRQEGRRWRPLEDTARANHLLRANSPSWGMLRRDQDYYDEGQLLWMEADAIIRAQSDGRRSLDDFCKKFLAPETPGVKIAPYTLTEVIQLLRDLADYDWEKFMEQRVRVPQDSLNLDVVGRLGYRLYYSAHSTEFLDDEEQERRMVSALDSLGLTVGDDGKIALVVPDMPADKAGLAPSMVIKAVNGRRFSSQRLKDGIADSVMRRKVELLLLEGDEYRTVTVNYADGLKYLKLMRDEDKPDILSAILKPVTTN